MLAIILTAISSISFIVAMFVSGSVWMGIIAVLYTLVTLYFGVLKAKPFIMGPSYIFGGIELLVLLSGVFRLIVGIWLIAYGVWLIIGDIIYIRLQHKR